MDVVHDDAVVSEDEQLARVRLLLAVLRGREGEVRRGQERAETEDSQQYHVYIYM